MHACLYIKHHEGIDLPRLEIQLFSFDYYGRRRRRRRRHHPWSTFKNTPTHQVVITVFFQRLSNSQSLSRVRKSRIFTTLSIDINICKFKLCDRITKSGGILHQFVIIVKYVDSGGYEIVK